MTNDQLHYVLARLVDQEYKLVGCPPYPRHLALPPKTGVGSRADPPVVGFSPLNGKGGRPHVGHTLLINGRSVYGSFCGNWMTETVSEQPLVVSGVGSDSYLRQ